MWKSFTFLLLVCLAVYIIVCQVWPRPLIGEGLLTGFGMHNQPPLAKTSRPDPLPCPSWLHSNNSAGRVPGKKPLGRNGRFGVGVSLASGVWPAERQ
jgi:hypothetical protein